MNLLQGSLARWERVFVCLALPPRLRGLLWTEERGGCDYGFCVYAMGMVGWRGSHRDPRWEDGTLDASF